MQGKDSVIGSLICLETDWLVTRGIIIFLLIYIYY
jgi:hypothetical protein